MGFIIKDNHEGYELNKELKGTVVEYQFIKEGGINNFIISIQLDGTNKVVRKTFFVDLINAESQFMEFCTNFDITYEDGELDLCELMYSDVIVCLVLAEGNKVIVDYIKKTPLGDYELKKYFI